MFIDTHAHLNLKEFKNDAEEVIKRTIGGDVFIINVGTDFETSKRAIELAEKYSGVYATVGFHPNDSSPPALLRKALQVGEEFNLSALRELAKNPKVVAIGETGLDYYRLKGDEFENKKRQKEIFKKQIELALELKKQLVIHCREAHSTSSGRAHDDLLDILNSYFLIHNSSLRGVIHSFSGNLEQAEKYREMGFKIAFNGIITFSSDYNEVVLKTPLEDILIETDCPFLTPVPYRGKRNEPLYVIEIAKKIAEIKNLSLEKTEKQTTKNAKELFNI
jgi:TatD DNase family protein